MDRDEFYRLFSFLKMSEYRRKIMQLLFEEGKPKTPTEIAERTEIHRDHVSRHLGKLKQRDLVEVINPKAPMHRYYALTDKGETMMQEIREKKSSPEEN